MEVILKKQFVAGSGSHDGIIGGQLSKLVRYRPDPRGNPITMPDFLIDCLPKDAIVVTPPNKEAIVEEKEPVEKKDSELFGMDIDRTRANAIAKAEKKAQENLEKTKNRIKKMKKEK
jgi:hypothetical protein